MYKSIDQWLGGYLSSVLRRPRVPPGPRHLLFCVADHFEPFRGGVPAAEARRLVEAWARDYPGAVAGFRDAEGHPPRHTFFYPQDEYDAPCLDTLAGLCRRGFGEVEIHLHHRHDTAEGLREKLGVFRDTLHARHGLLGVDGGGRVRYGFVHGNWALCNSRPDGDWCGVNEELGVLAETGCYADFTFPSAPSPTQPRMVNALYYAADRPGRPRGHDRGIRVRVGRPATAVEGGRGGASPTLHPADSCRLSGGPRSPSAGWRFTGSRPSPPSPGGRGPPEEAARRLGDDPSRRLMLITGPLALNWRRRKWGLVPRLENGELSGANPPAADRLHLWVRQGIHVGGRPEWVFVKVHTHGCVPANRAAVMDTAMRGLHAHLAEQYNDGRRWVLHHVTAREMFNVIRAAEDGLSGDPGGCRDHAVGPPPCRGAG
jgi:hypothetical protein